MTSLEKYQRIQQNSNKKQLNNLEENQNHHSKSTATRDNLGCFCSIFKRNIFSSNKNRQKDIKQEVSHKMQAYQHSQSLGKLILAKKQLLSKNKNSNSSKVQTVISSNHLQNLSITVSSININIISPQKQEKYQQKLSYPANRKTQFDPMKLHYSFVNKNYENSQNTSGAASQFTSLSNQSSHYQNRHFNNISFRVDSLFNSNSHSLSISKSRQSEYQQSVTDQLKDSIFKEQKKEENQIKKIKLIRVKNKPVINSLQRLDIPKEIHDQIQKIQTYQYMQSQEVDSSGQNDPIHQDHKINQDSLIPSIEKLQVIENISNSQNLIMPEQHLNNVEKKYYIQNEKFQVHNRQSLKYIKQIY